MHDYIFYLKFDGTILFSLMSPSSITIVIVRPEVYLVTSIFGTLYGVTEVWFMAVY